MVSTKFFRCLIFGFVLTFVTSFKASVQESAYLKLNNQQNTEIRLLQRTELAPDFSNTEEKEDGQYSSTDQQSDTNFENQTQEQDDNHQTGNLTQTIGWDNQTQTVFQDGENFTDANATDNDFNLTDQLDFNQTYDDWIFDNQTNWDENDTGQIVIQFEDGNQTNGDFDHDQDENDTAGIDDGNQTEDGHEQDNQTSDENDGNQTFDGKDNKTSDSSNNSDHDHHEIDSNKSNEQPINSVETPKEVVPTKNQTNSSTQTTVHNATVNNATVYNGTVNNATVNNATVNKTDNGASTSNQSSSLPLNQFNFTLLINLDLATFNSKLSDFKSALINLISDPSANLTQKQTYLQITKISSGSVNVEGVLAATSASAIENTKKNFVATVAAGSSFAGMSVLSSVAAPIKYDTSSGTTTTTTTTTQSSSSSSNTGMIIGIAVGVACAVIIGIGVASYFLFCKKKESSIDKDLNEKRTSSTIKRIPIDDQLQTDDQVSDKNYDVRKYGQNKPVFV